MRRNSRPTYEDLPLQIQPELEDHSSRQHQEIEKEKIRLDQLMMGERGRAQVYSQQITTVAQEDDLELTKKMDK